MDFQFKSLAAALGLKSADAAITDANLKQANDKIEALERDKAGAEQKAADALASLETAQADLKTANASLKTANDKVATLEQWKKEQKATDGREEDASNGLDEESTEKLSAFELATKQAVGRVQARHGNKNKGK
ncbi:hypothetical protein GCM10027048_20290 [Hymenobacter coalescens]